MLVVVFGKSSDLAKNVKKNHKNFLRKFGEPKARGDKDTFCYKGALFGEKSEFSFCIISLQKVLST